MCRCKIIKIKSLGGINNVENPLEQVMNSTVSVQCCHTYLLGHLHVKINNNDNAN